MDLGARKRRVVVWRVDRGRSGSVEGVSMPFLRVGGRFSRRALLLALRGGGGVSMGLGRGDERGGGKLPVIFGEF